MSVTADVNSDVRMIEFSFLCCVRVPFFFIFVLQSEPLFIRTYDEADGDDVDDTSLRFHNIVHSSLDVVGERKGERIHHIY